MAKAYSIEYRWGVKDLAEEEINNEWISNY